MRAFLGLGANLVQPKEQIRAAIEALRASIVVRVLSVSPLYASAPMGPQDQPDYVNAVVEIETQLEPIALLDFCQGIEQAHHRQRKVHWGARTLDVDILSISDCIMMTDRLILPHPGIALRDFVVLPWRDIAPDYFVPSLDYVKNIRVENGFSAHLLTESETESYYHE